MKNLGIFLLFNCLAFALTDRIAKFHSFKREFNKNYLNLEEEHHRLEIFHKNLENIEKHNERFEKGLSTFKLGLNKAFDLSAEEFLKKRTGLLISAKSLVGNQNKITFLLGSNKQSNIQVLDWREKGVISQVEDQGFCGSCWAFAANGALEGHWAIKFGFLNSLSEQNLLDCSRPFGNEGCKGGLMQMAYNYIKNNKGINNQNNYPYEATEKTCRYRSNLIAGSIKGYVDLPTGNENALEEAVKLGPVSVGIEATQDFIQYKSGIYMNPTCSRRLNHALLVVGFNNTNKPPFWIIKNSWGKSWGENGFGRILKGNNTCGIADYASYPVIF